MSERKWEWVEDGVYRFRDSCWVYAVKGPEGTVLVNAGTGRGVDYLHELGDTGDLTVILTHHFRDHSDGALRYRDAGARIMANYWDQHYYLDPHQHFRERQVWNSYDNRWDRFAPIRPIPVDGWMMDYGDHLLGGLEWHVIPSPGVTQGASSYVMERRGRRLAFVGETLIAGGKVARLAPLQYDYNDTNGAVNLWYSARRILEAAPDRLLPSMGDPIDDPGAAVASLRQNLKLLAPIGQGFEKMLQEPGDGVEQILPHLYLSRNSVALTHFVVSESGNVLALDYGYNQVEYLPPARSDLTNRRPLLHGMDGLKQVCGAERIDTVLITHYHDDHVNGIPMLQRLFGTKAWAAGHFADILERPERYDRPCLWHEPIALARRLPCGEPFTWEEYPIALYPMSGHTRFSTLVCMEIDGVRVAHTGDQIFFHNEAGLPNFTAGSRLFTNHVYKNGLDLGCYKETARLLREFQPDLILSGHMSPYRTTPEWYDVLDEGAEAFDVAHRTLMHLGLNEIHFGAESQAAKLKPYHAVAPPDGLVQLEGWVLNPFPTAAAASLTLVAPQGWESEPLEFELQPREQREFRMKLQVPVGTRCRRQPVALDLVVGGQPFGQVAEALVTSGSDRF